MWWCERKDDIRCHTLNKLASTFLAAVHHVSILFWLKRRQAQALDGWQGKGHSIL